MLGDTANLKVTARNEQIKTKFETKIKTYGKTNADIKINKRTY